MPQISTKQWLCRIPTAGFWPSPWKVRVKEISFIWKLQGTSVLMFSKFEFFSQVFLKNIGLRCRKFIIQNRTFADQLLVAACDVLDLFAFVSYWDLFRTEFLTEPHFVSKVVFKDVYSANYSCSLIFLLTVARVDYFHYEKISWYSRNIIVSVSWQNYFLTSMGDYVQPHISRCGHTLEINTFILVNLISYEKICKLCIHT